MRAKALLLSALFLSACARSEYHPEQDRISTAPAAPTTVDVAHAAPVNTDPFAGVERLSGTILLDAILERSPAIEAKRASARAALARYPQSRAFGDPTVGFELAPRTLGDDPLGYQITVSQPLPWPSLLRDQGRAAMALAEAAEAQIGIEQRHHVLESRQAFAEYWFGQRKLDLNQRARELVTGLRDASLANVKSSGEAIAAELELAQLERDRLTAERERITSAMMINALLGRTADAPLPPPVEKLPNPRKLRDTEELKHLARQRPEVVEIERRLEAAQRELALANRSYTPQVALTGGYSKMEEDPDMQLTVGVQVTVPLSVQKRRGLAEEKRAEIDRLRAELAAELAESDREVLDARARLDEGERAIALIRGKTMPAAKQAVSAAQAAYAAGSGSLAMLVTALRSQLAAEVAEADELHEYYHQQGNLECCIGLRVVGEGNLAPEEAGTAP